MTKDEEQFEAWWLTKFSAEFLDSDNCHSAWTGWKARGELDAKRIAELEAKLHIAIEALENCLGGDDYYNRPLITEALAKIKGE
jgi:hypothetical protein